MQSENKNAMRNARRKSRGFTLVELMITIAVAAILLSVAVPSYRDFMASSRITAQANDLITALNLARSEAVKRAATIAVCSSSNGIACGGTWQQGWLIHAAGTPLRVQSALSGSSSLTAGTDIGNTVSFTSAGRTLMPAGATPASTSFTLCPPAPAAVQGRVIQLERTGRTRVASVNCP